MPSEKREKDPQQELPLLWCSYCGGEIYEGSLYYAIGRHTVCRLCLGRYAFWYFVGNLCIAARPAPRPLRQILDAELPEEGRAL